MKCNNIYCYQPITKYELNKYNGICQFCFANLYPEDEKSLFIKRKSKELKVISYILNIFKNWIYDKSFYVDLEGGCCATKRRIDLRYLYLNTMICLEIDENQHKYYIEYNENERYNDLFMDFSGKYIFIRYNPDEYNDENQIKQNPEFDKRMKILINIINLIKLRIKNELNEDLIEIYNIFYDEKKENENNKILELNDILEENSNKYDKILEIETNDEEKINEINKKIEKYILNQIKCEYCKKNITKINLLRHQNSQKCRNKQQNRDIILPLKEYKCKYCNKIFNRLDYKNDHENNMKCNVKDIYNILSCELKEKNKELELKNEIIQQKDELLKQKDDDITYFKSQLQLYKPNIINTTNNTINNITIQNNINIYFGEIQNHLDKFNIHILSNHSAIINFLMSIFENKVKLTNECKQIMSYYVQDKLINDIKCKRFLSNSANEIKYISNKICQEGKSNPLLSDTIVKSACINNMLIHSISTEKGIKRGIRRKIPMILVHEIIKYLKEKGIVEIKGV